MTLIGETGLERDLTDRHWRISKQILDEVYSLPLQPLMRRTANCLLESFDKMLSRNAAFFRDVGNTEVGLEIVGQ